MADIDYGPLTGLIGTWKGDKGMDVAPEADGPDENPYYETIVFEPIGDVENAESQTLVVLRYQQIVSRKSNDEVFHDETGYWMWDAAADVVMHSLLIPRAVGILAGGKTPQSDEQGGVTLEVHARLNDPDWGIIQSPFMRNNARTLEFHHHLTVLDNQLSYKETTVLDIYGKVFDHTDENELTRIDD